MTCKDCIHRELCADYVSSLAKVQNADVEYISQWLDEIEGKKNQIDNECEHFADRSQFVEIPLKVGTRVWFIPPISWTFLPNPSYEYMITNFIISCNKKVQWTKKYRAMRIVNEKTIDSAINFSFDDIGERIFLTREGAEQKIKERENTEANISTVIKYDSSNTMRDFTIEEQEEYNKIIEDLYKPTGLNIDDVCK